MTDQATAGAAAAGTSADAAVTAATPGSQAAGAPDFLAGLQNAESRHWVESKGIRSLDTLAESARYADGIKKEFDDFKAQALTLPSDDAKPEDLDAFFGKLGMPEKADGYDFRMPEGLPAELPYDAEFAKDFKAWARDARLPAKQAQALHDAYVKNFASRAQAAADAQAKISAETEAKAAAELSQAWGQPGTDAFNHKLGFVDRAITQGGIKDELVALGVMDAQGVARSPKIAQFLAAAGEALYSEDRAIVGGVSLAGNPFAKGSENETAQMLLYRQDPSRAKSLIAAAGRQPGEFGL